MLRIYISAHCFGYDTAVQRVEHLRALRPEIPVILVDIEAPDAAVPRQVIGTPIYIWNDLVVFMGNPSEQELLERLEKLQHDAPY